MKKIILILSAMIQVSMALAQIKNPVLPGFYPDPSICRAGADYYLVNSSFSYFPGIPIFHSRDLVHWKQIGHVLDRRSQLNISSQSVSAGIYAPTIRYYKGIFYVISTFVGGKGTFIVTAKNPSGPWSDPVWLKEVDGIDPSLFFDDDGHSYIVNNGPPPDNRPLYAGHRAIWIQSLDLQTMMMSGERKLIINGGTDLNKKPVWIEGPHVFKKNGYYYLIAAEGGTEHDHSEVVFRASELTGPYETFCGNPILTQRDLPDDRPNAVTCAGHADMVQTSSGKWVSVFLACQPYEKEYFNNGRQTFMLPVHWENGWPVILAKGVSVPGTAVIKTTGHVNETTFAKSSAHWRDEFATHHLKFDWNFLRTPQVKWYDIRDGKLRITARPERIDSVCNPSFIGRRQQHAAADMRVAISLEPNKDMEGGLVAFQNEKHYYKAVVKQSGAGASLLVSSGEQDLAEVRLDKFKSGGIFFLRISCSGDLYQFYYSANNTQWIPAGRPLDGKLLSTAKAGGFVGCYWGLYAHASSPAILTCTNVTYDAVNEIR